jgi:ligand-binding sensor domain-containing protein
MRTVLTAVLVVMSCVVPACSPALEPPLPMESTPMEGISTLRPPGDIFALLLDGTTLWCGGVDGVCAVDTRTRTVTAVVDAGRPMTYVRGMAQDRSGALWFASERGLVRWSSGVATWFTSKDGLPDNRVNSVIVTRSGDLWAGTWRGAARRTAGGWEVLHASDGLADDMTRVMLEDSGGSLWFGSYVAPAGGLAIRNASGWQMFSTAAGLPHNNVVSLLEVPDGTVWVGTGFLDDGGAVQFEREGDGWQVRRVLDKLGGLAGGKARSIYVTRDGTLVVGSEFQGIAIETQGGFRVLTIADGLSNDEVKVMTEDRDGNLWCGTRDGLTIIDRQTLLNIQGGTS